MLLLTNLNEIAVSYSLNEYLDFYGCMQKMNSAITVQLNVLKSLLTVSDETRFP